MPKYGLIVVEGPHDIEFVRGLLRPFGLTRVQYDENLDTYLATLVNRKYPAGGDLLRRHPVPLFLQSATHAIAIQQANGDSGLVQTVADSRLIIDFVNVTGVGIILDSDSEQPPLARYAAVKEEALKAGLSLPEVAGEVSDGKPRFGGYVLPDNQAPGTLEDLLLECGEAAYPTLFPTAHGHVQAAFNDLKLSADDSKDLKKPAGRKKAVVSTVASVLRPGKSIQVSIQDNKWLRGENLQLARIKAVQEFLVKLLELA